MPQNDKDPTMTNPEVPDVNIPEEAEADDVAKALKELARIHKRLKDEYPLDLRLFILNNLQMLAMRETKQAAA